MNNLAYLRDKSLRLLARREHSRFELFNKLKNSKNITNEINETDINQLLDTLEEQNLLSEERFITSYIRMRIRAGRGEKLIVSELSKRGINQQQAKNILNTFDIDWMQILQDVWQQKFAKLPKNQKEYAKQINFLLSRGFNYQDIVQLLK